MREPFDEPTAQRLIREILENGEVVFSRHCEDELREDNLTTLDCTRVLRGGWIEPPDFERGSWRYRVRSARICVVVAFRSETKLVVVTAWRDQP